MLLDKLGIIFFGNSRSVFQSGHKTKIAEEKRQFKRKIFMTAFGLLCIVTVRCLAVEAEGELSQERNFMTD